MPSAKRRFKEERFESIMKRFKRAVEKDNTIQEYRRREFYEKPSIVRKKAKAAARKRHLRTLEEETDLRSRNPSIKSKANKEKEEKFYN